MTNRNEEIARLWNDEKSGAEIGSIMGISRSAVLGLVHRMRHAGAELRVTRQNGRKKSDARPTPKVFANPKNYIPVLPKEVVVPPIVKPPEITEGRWVPILETGRHTCKYSVDGKLFCNSPEGSPWCPEHKKKVMIQR